jgi:hypothetical protein
MSKLPQNLRQLELLDGSARNPYNTWCNAFYPAIGTSNTLSRLVVHGQVDTISFATIMTAVILNERASPIDMRFSSVTDGMMNTETGAIMTKAISGEQRVVMGLLVGFQDSHLPPMKKDFETAYIASVMRNPHLLRIDVIHNDSGEVEAKIARNRIRVLSWAQVAIALSCLRANLANTFRDACRPLIPAIMECSVVHPFGEIEGPYFASVNGRSSVQPLTLKRVDAFLSTRFACSHLEIVGHKRKYA